MPYQKTQWINNNEPSINATNLNKIEQGIYDNSIALETQEGLLGGHTVRSDVPSDAVFTDTTYTAGQNVQINGTTISATDTVYDDTALAGRVSTVEGLLDGHSVATDVPSDAVFTDTIYDDTALSGRVGVVEGLLDGHSVATNVPANALFTDTVYDDTELSSRVTDAEEAIEDLQETTEHLSDGEVTYPYAPEIEIEDALGVNAKSVKVKIGPVQSGNGTPSPNNVRPFIGWDFCRIDNTGKNLWNPNEFYFGYIPDATALAGSATAKSAIIKCKPNTTYAIYKPIGNRFRVCFTKEYPANGVSVYGFMEDDPQNGGGVFTTGEGAEYIVAFVYTASDVSYTYTWEDVQNSLMVVESQTIPSVYESYKGKTYTINLGETIYVGELDATKGILTADYSLKEFDGSNDETITQLDTTEQDKKRFSLTIPDCKTYTLEAEELTGEIWCNQLVETTNINTYYALSNGIHYRITNVHEVIVYIEGISSVADMRTYLATKPLQVLYRLAETKIIQLTPQQIPLLDGYNYLQANTGDISITTTDIKGAIGQADELIEANTQAIHEIDSLNDSIFGTVENGTTASKAYAQDDYFVKDKKMCKALTSIAQGATFTLGTNYAQYTLAEILKAIEQS